MLAFEVIVNGKRLCIAGVGPNLVIGTDISWTHRHPDNVAFHVGGMTADGSMKHIAWTTPSIHVGDEVCIRLIETDTCDEPDRVYDPALERHDDATPSQA